MCELMQNSRQQLLEDVIISFVDADYTTTEIYRSRTFDIVAKSKDIDSGDDFNSPILTKVLKNLDNFKLQHSKEMELFSKLIGATPLLIAQFYQNHHTLQDNLLYNRHKINAITLKTLRNLLQNNVSPHKIAVRGSKYNNIRINTKKLVEYFRQTGISQNKISDEVSVSRQSLLNYQKGITLPSEQNFQNLVNFIDKILKISSSNSLKKPFSLLEPFDKNDYDLSTNYLFQKKLNRLSQLQQEVEEHLIELDFQHFWFRSLPWDGISQSQEEITERSDGYRFALFTGVESQSLSNNAFLSKRIKATKLIMNFLNQKGIWVIQDKETKDSLKNKTPELDQGNLRILDVNEFQKIKNKKQLQKETSK